MHQPKPLGLEVGHGEGKAAGMLTCPQGSKGGAKKAALNTIFVVEGSGGTGGTKVKGGCKTRVRLGPVYERVLRVIRLQILKYAVSDPGPQGGLLLT